MHIWYHQIPGWSLKDRAITYKIANKINGHLRVADLWENILEKYM